MKQSDFQKIFFLFLLMGTVLLTACGGSGELTYRITGSSGTAEVTYTDGEGNEQIETVSLPWEKTLEAPSDGSYEIAALREDGTGISCDVLFNGESLGSAEDAQVYISCSGSYQVGRNSRSVINQSSKDVLPDGTSALPKVGSAALTDTAADWQDRLDRLEYSRYEHNMDCTAIGEPLIAVHFAIDHLSEGEIENCEERGEDSTYARIVAATDSGFGDVTMVVGYNNHPLNESEYPAYAEDEITAFADSLIDEVFPDSTLRQQPEFVADINYIDYDFVQDGQNAFFRTVAIPNFDTGSGLLLLFIAPAFGDDIEDEYV
ncbi:MAG: MmpS family transport accessory protein, partial [Chloroflexota bacterium]